MRQRNQAVPSLKACFPAIDRTGCDRVQLDTRIVIPLGKASYFGSELMARLQIQVSYDDQEFVLMTPQISSIPRSTLKEPIGSLQHLQQEIIDALDFAITGI